MRNSTYLQTRLFSCIFSTLLIIAVYPDLDNDEESILSRNGLLNFVMLNTDMIAFMSVTNTYYLDWAVFLKE